MFPLQSPTPPAVKRALTHILLWRAALVGVGVTPLLLMLPLGETAEFVLAPLAHALAGTCQRYPERALVLGGTLTPVCSRCMGLYAGLATGALLRPQWRTEVLFAAFVFGLLLMALDVASEWVGLRPPSAPLRLLTGLAVSVPAGWLLSAPSRLTSSRSLARPHSPTR